ncbi:acyltransferase (plasmid) [Deinococcus metallilatus]|uniref:Peptidoglycan/LPS O-acetylase OafA/YrhL n=1 Tax=Deinococcus metallilatus TaxID=1211322 RepID=A0ABR6MV02_9DEIO|nr:acyltransferase [Deinococcus metallilatus]MBB5295769.1 peptidoglycan/LPS O-acetylase OafA/YrhL [Deinococcus metallilatus]QBY06793.1 acyltransferase [Deinococcus metallilatus]GMA14298.1 acyltransferase [Deinococcus metallilatus]
MARPSARGGSSAPAAPLPVLAPERRGTAARLPAVDIFRGLAIIAVVAHHLTGFALRQAADGSALGEGLALLNRTLHFVVPAFVFMTAVVLTRSALRHFEPRTYYWARVRTALLPYLLWTVLYVLFRVATGQDRAAALGDPGRWQVWLQYGKGYFHLYFLLIVLQFYLVLPLLLPLWRRAWPFLAVLLGAFALQFAVYFLNRAGLVHFRFPGTMAWWYIPAITLGMYFGANDGAFEAFWRRGWAWALAAALLALVWYVPVSVAALRGAQVNTLTYSAANWAYTTAAALGLFGAAHVLAHTRTWGRTALISLGTVSLQVYLLHPAVMWPLEHWGLPGKPLWFVVVLAGYAVLALGVPVLLAWALAGTPVSRWLFGR